MIRFPLRSLIRTDLFWLLTFHLSIEAGRHSPIPSWYCTYAFRCPCVSNRKRCRVWGSELVVARTDDRTGFDTSLSWFLRCRGCNGLCDCDSRSGYGRRANGFRDRRGRLRARCHGFSRERHSLSGERVSRHGDPHDSFGTRYPHGHSHSRSGL